MTIKTLWNAWFGCLPTGRHTSAYLRIWRGCARMSFIFHATPPAETYSSARSRDIFADLTPLGTARPTIEGGLERGRSESVRQFMEARTQSYHWSLIFCLVIHCAWFLVHQWYIHIRYISGAYIFLDLRTVARIHYAIQKLRTCRIGMNSQELNNDKGLLWIAIELIQFFICWFQFLICRTWLSFRLNLGFLFNRT